MKCDGKANTLTIIKAKVIQLIFGAFASIAWDCSGQYKTDRNAFLFSLLNQENRPCKMKIRLNKIQSAIRCHALFGPTFGAGSDLSIANNAHKSMNSYSNLGSSYELPHHVYGSVEANSFLAGSRNFQAYDIEVYQRYLNF